MSNADFPEIVWCVFALAGFMINAWALKEALADQAWLAMARLDEVEEAIQVVMARLARENVRQEMMRTIKQLVFLIGAIIRMSLPNAISPPNAPFPPTTVAVVTIVIVSFIMCLNSVFEMQARREAMRLLRVAENRKGIQGPAGPAGAKGDTGPRGLKGYGDGS